MCGYTILQSCQCNGIDRNQGKCGVFECLLSSFSWEAGFEAHVLFEVVVKRFIGVPLDSISSGTMFYSAVICVNLLVSVVSANPFVVFLLVEEAEFEIKISVDVEIMVFPGPLISIVNVIQFTKRVVYPVFLWFIEEVCSKMVFGDRDVFVARVSSINSVFMNMDMDLLEHFQVLG